MLLVICFLHFPTVLLTVGTNQYLINIKCNAFFCCFNNNRYWNLHTAHVTAFSING